MDITNKVLRMSSDFDNAMFFAKTVSVWSNGEIIDYGGPIEKHTDDAVYINGGLYIKENFEFKVKS